MVGKSHLWNSIQEQQSLATALVLNSQPLPHVTWPVSLLESAPGFLLRAASCLFWWAQTSKRQRSTLLKPCSKSLACARDVLKRPKTGAASLEKASSTALKLAQACATIAAFAPPHRNIHIRHRSI